MPMNFWEIMQGMIPGETPDSGSMYPWDEGYLNEALANYINQLGTSYDVISSEAFEGGWTNIGGSMEWEDPVMEQNCWFDTSGPPSTWGEVCQDIPVGGGWNPGEEGREIDFERWKEEYADYFPTFNIDDFNNLTSEYRFDKDNLINQLTTQSESTLRDPRSVIMSDDDRDVVEDTIAVASRLKDFSYLNDIGSLVDSYEADLYSSFADLAGTGAFAFLDNPEELEWIQGGAPTGPEEGGGCACLNIGIYVDNPWTEDSDGYCWNNYPGGFQTASLCP